MKPIINYVNQYPIWGWLILFGIIGLTVWSILSGGSDGFNCNQATANYSGCPDPEDFKDNSWRNECRVFNVNGERIVECG